MLSALVLAAVQAGSAQPDVLILILDDVAVADVESIPTPNMDALASSGIRFTRAYSHAWCAPTRDSLLRSVWRGTYHGDLCAGYDPEWTLDQQSPTLPRLFQERGYATYLVGKWHLGVASSTREDPTLSWTTAPTRFGFDHWRAGVTSSAVGGCDPPAGGANRVDDGVVSRDSRYRTVQQRDAVLEALQEARDAARPFLGVVGFTDAHSPWRVPARQILPRRFKPGSTPRERFEAEVVALDLVIGELVAALPEDAWILVLGDNGTPERVAPDPRRAKTTTFERGVRVPMILRGPGVVPREVSAPVHVVDVLPTLCDALGWAVPDWAEGTSLVPLFDGRDIDRPWVFVWNQEADDRAVVEARWKLRRVAGVEQLYDLVEDPEERTPLPPVGEDAQRLRALLATLP